MIVTQSDIVVNEQDVWTFQGNEIFRDEVLLYFRQNLHYAPNLGYYLENIFGEKVEWAQLAILGFPLHVVDIQPGAGSLFKAGCDDQNWYQLKPEQVFCWQTDCLWLEIEHVNVEGKKSRIPARLGRAVMVQLAELLEENGDRLIWSASGAAIEEKQPLFQAISSIK